MSGTPLSPAASLYATVEDLKQSLGITDSSDDTMLDAILAAVSRQIDQYTNRRFYATTETRFYTARRVSDVIIDDCLSITTLATDADGDRVYEKTWSATDFDLYPYNATPYTRVEATVKGAYLFPVNIAKGVKIIGSFGYSATVPEPVNRACLIQAARLYKRKDALFGVMGSAEMGQLLVIPKMDPDVKLLLSGYIKPAFG